MPLIRIDTAARHDETATADRLRALGDAVHQAITETIDVPRDDRFQILNSHPAGRLSYDRGYLGIERDEDFVIVAITMRAGRTDTQKAALYRRIADLVQERTGIEPRNVMVSITENQPADWSFGDGVGQYIS